MDEKTHTITCRLDEPDYQKLKSEAAALGVNTSDYIRLIVRLPIEANEKAHLDGVIIIDPLTLVRLWMDARRQGYLLNQATKALNTVALKVRHGSEINRTLRDMLIEATVALENLEADHHAIKEGIDEVSAAQKVFLDRYRRRPCNEATMRSRAFLSILRGL